MGRFAFIILTVLLVVAAAGAVLIGLFPPEPQQAAVERVLPLDRFGSR